MRRMVPSIPMSVSSKGALAVKWQGWMKAFTPGYRNAVYLHGLRRWNTQSVNAIWDLPDICGVYAFLNRQGYVLYIGRSKNLRREMDSVLFNRWPSYRTDYVTHFSAHQCPGQTHSKNIELSAIRFYVPPWNTRHAK